MNSKNTNSYGRRFTAAALMVAAAGALTVGGLGAAATANAKPIIQPAPSPVRPQASGELYAGIAYSSDTGLWVGYANATSFNDLNENALSVCQSKGGGHCVLTGFSKNQCVALAVNADNNEIWQSGVGQSQISAMNAALGANGGGRIATTACTNPGAPPQSFFGHVNTPDPSVVPPKIKFRPLV